jgi:hypothetical protein
LSAPCNWAELPPQRSKRMTSRLASRSGFVIWRCLAVLLSGGALLASCVAQEPYKSSQAMGGSAGSTGVGSGGLQLTNPDGAAAGAGGDGSLPGEPVPVGCRSSDECASPLPYCSVLLARCVECLSQRNCAGTGRPYCELTMNTCVYCLSDAQCPHAAPYCATTIGACVECLSTDNCGSAGLACDRDNYHCVPTCKSHADCASSPLKPFCDPERNLCVACVTDDACPASTPRCAADTETCVKCLGDDDCASPSPRCDVKKRACVECLTNRDCQTGVQCVAGACANPR